MSYDEFDDLPASVEAEEPLAGVIGVGLSPEQVEALRKPLDRDHVKKREGKYSYIETHHAIRTANRIFGFGGWGYRIVEQREIAAVPVTGERGPGYMVGWYCRVELTVGSCPPVSGSGYGDGIEYGGERSRIKACELALKESESDALKRALRNYGDQFGLILYAKDNERAAIENESKQAVAREPEGVPVSVPDALEVLRSLGITDAGDWFKAAWHAVHGVLVETQADIEPGKRGEAISRLHRVAVFLEKRGFHGGGVPFPNPEDIQAAFADAFEGVLLEDPRDDAGVNASGAEATAEAV